MRINTYHSILADSAGDQFDIVDVHSIRRMQQSITSSIVRRPERRRAYVLRLPRLLMCLSSRLREIARHTVGATETQ
jgi:hypothetical protein